MNLNQISSPTNCIISNFVQFNSKQLNKIQQCQMLVNLLQIDFFLVKTKRTIDFKSCIFHRIAAKLQNYLKSNFDAVSVAISQK